jgi:uroporphyrinogen decarboxylase
MQTSLEIIDGLIRNRPVERIGLYDSIWGDTLSKWVEEEGYPRNDEGNPVPSHDYFDFDLRSCGGRIDGMPLRGHSEMIEETEEWVLSRNGAGAALKYWKHKSGTPEHVDFRMTSREIWDRDYRPYLLDFDPLRLDIEDARQKLDQAKAEGRWTFYGNLFIWELMRCSMGDMCMYESLLLDPDWIHDYNRVYTDFFKMQYKHLIEEVGKPDGIWLYEDLGYHKGLFCSPSTLESLIFPYYKEMVDFFKSYDLPVVLHSCGNITEALELVVGAGFDALNPMEAKAGCDVVDFAKRHGDRLAFVGGMDALIFESGDRKRIRDEVIRLCTTFKDMGARYIFGSDHSISPNVKLADFQYALEVYKENMMY